MSRYTLPSMKYHMSIHDIHMTHLDHPAKGFLKKWLNFPTRGVTDIPYLLSIKAPSQLCMEGHLGNYALMRIKADSTVNLALNSRLERENLWTNK